MTLATDKVHAGMDLSDLLRDNEILGGHSNQLWTITVHDTPGPEASPADDFLDALLDGSDSSLATSSPLWSPCTAESGISEDPPADPVESFHPLCCTQSSPLEHQPPPNKRTPYVSIDLEWESSDIQEQLGIAYYLTTNQTSPLSSTQALTVKDLLLGNLGQKTQQIPQNPLQELELNEDEKKLLAKEGVNLPNKLPLSKFEERVLKKIRRKIRNKHSAQESRKKRREYVDSLEGRMSACSANNLLLQRKIQELEETNKALMEQLSRLQAVLPHRSSRAAHSGTCIMVFLLSFSLLISSTLQPEPYSLHSRREYAQNAAPSRSLHSVDDVPDAPPLPVLSASRGLEDLWGLTEKR